MAARIAASMIKGGDFMRSKCTNQKHFSRFICLKCGRTDGVTPIYRAHTLKEHGHVKDLYCVHCHDVTKCLEIRNRDYLPDVMDQARDLAEEYYGKVNKDVLLNDGVLASSFF